MTDWYSNGLTVTGDAETLEKFRERVCGDVQNHHGLVEESELSFERIVPTPSILLEDDDADIDAALASLGPGDVEALIRRTRRMSALRRRARLSACGYESWSDFRAEQWGTKWEPCDLETVSGANEIAYSFLTASGPPVWIVEAVAREFPTLEFRLSTGCAAHRVQGNFECSGGEITRNEKRFWDAYGDAECHSQDSLDSESQGRVDPDFDDGAPSDE